MQVVTIILGERDSSSTLETVKPVGEIPGTGGVLHMMPVSLREAEAYRAPKIGFLVTSAGHTTG